MQQRVDEHRPLRFVAHELAGLLLSVPAAIAPVKTS